MKRIIQAFDDRIRAILPGRGFFMPGLCELVTEEGTKYPVTIGERRKVSMDDKFDGLIYHRTIANSTSTSDEYSFGMRTPVQHSVQIRTVCAYRVELGENIKYEICSSIPSLLRLSGFEFINTEPNSFNEDHEQVVTQEFIKVPYHKHRLPWNVFSFDTNVEFVICKNECLQNI